MSTYRIPRTEAEMAVYLIETTTYLKQHFAPIVSRTVGPDSTENLYTGQLPPYMEMRLGNTGGMDDPELHFCLAMDGDGSCPVGGSLPVAPGDTKHLTVSELGNPVLQHLNVTNSSAEGTGQCVVHYPRNWVRLGLMEAQVVEWEARGKAWLMAYMAAKDDSKRTPDVVTDKNRFADEFTAFAEPVLNQIAGSMNLVTSDYSTFNIAPPNKDRSARPKIETSPWLRLAGMAGCNMRFSCRREQDANRASMHPDATALELRWLLLPHDAPAPQSPAECTGTHMSTRAIFTLDLGVENAGMRLHCYVRWVNLREPHKSGPWGTRHTMVLSD